MEILERLKRMSSGARLDGEPALADLLWDAHQEIARLRGHDSDCATHNEPAMPNGPCDCSLSH